ncbi:MAG: thioredoxin family protein, partial [Planctomycetota bacterium]
MKFLEPSPYAAELADAIADFRLYGGMRNIKALIGEAGLAAAKAARAKKYADAITLYRKEAGRPDVEPAVKMFCMLEAGKAASRAKDLDAARAAFAEAAVGKPCRERMMALVFLGMIETRSGNLAKAMEHLEAAVAEGSAACGLIAGQKGKSLKALFTAEDESIRSAAEALTDATAADAPIAKRIAEAKAKAAKEGKKVILFWYGPYCPYVMAMRERLAHPEVKALLEKHFVLVTVDQGAPHRLAHLDEEYGEVMSCFGVPCFLVLKGDDASPDVRTDSGLMGAEGRTYSVELIVEWLKESAEAE